MSKRELTIKPSKEEVIFWKEYTGKFNTWERIAEGLSADIADNLFNKYYSEILNDISNKMVKITKRHSLAEEMDKRLSCHVKSRRKFHGNNHVTATHKYSEVPFPQRKRRTYKEIELDALKNRKHKSKKDLLLEQLNRS